MPKPKSNQYLMLALVAVLALGLLSIPAVGVLRKAEEGAPANELRDIQAAVTIMMTHQGISVIPHPITEPTNDMSRFPDPITPPTLKGLLAEDKPGYVLYQHDNKASSIPEGTVDYVRTSTTQWYYTVDADGTVTQWRQPPTKDE